MQAFQYSSEEDKAVSISAYGTAEDGSNATLGATGNGHEKITMNTYSAALGFDVNDIPYVRPYGGVVFSTIDGTDEASFAGTGQVSTAPPTGGIVTTHPSGPVSFSVKRKIKSESSINGIVGMTLNPDKPAGITLEGQFGNATSYFFSGFMRF